MDKLRYIGYNGQAGQAIVTNICMCQDTNFENQTKTKTKFNRYLWDKGKMCTKTKRGVDPAVEI